MTTLTATHAAASAPVAQHADERQSETITTIAVSVLSVAIVVSGVALLAGASVLGAAALIVAALSGLGLAVDRISAEVQAARA